MTAFNKPLSNLQIELLQLYSNGVSEDNLVEIKNLLAQYFANQASDEMDRLWEKNNWSDETMDEWLSDDETSSKK